MYPNLAVNLRTGLRPTTYVNKRGFDDWNLIILKPIQMLFLQKLRQSADGTMIDCIDNLIS